MQPNRKEANKKKMNIQWPNKDLQKNSLKIVVIIYHPIFLFCPCNYIKKKNNDISNDFLIVYSFYC